MVDRDDLHEFSTEELMYELVGRSLARHRSSDNGKFSHVIMNGIGHAYLNPVTILVFEGDMLKKLF